MTSDAAANIKAARRTNGQFGNQHRDEPTTDGLSVVVVDPQAARVEASRKDIAYARAALDLFEAELDAYEYAIAHPNEDTLELPDDHVLVATHGPKVHLNVLREFGSIRAERSSWEDKMMWATTGRHASAVFTPTAFTPDFVRDEWCDLLEAEGIDLDSQPDLSEAELVTIGERGAYWFDEDSLDQAWDERRTATRMAMTEVLRRRLGDDTSTAPHSWSA